jgi:hypothetical protein
MEYVYSTILSWWFVNTNKQQFQRPSSQVRNASSKNLNQWSDGMRVDISKSKFFAKLIEYLDPWYWITRQGIQLIGNKVEMNAILNIKAPKTWKEEPTTPDYWYNQLW